VSESWFNTGNWLGLGGGYWPGCCEGNYPSCPTDDTVYFLGASAQRKCTMTPPSEPVPLVAVYADQAYGAYNSDFGVYGDPGFEVPGGTIRWYGGGAVYLKMFALGFPAVVELHTGAYIGDYMYTVGQGIYVYDQPGGSFPPPIWGFTTKVFLLKDDLYAHDGMSDLWIEADVEDWMDGLMPGEPDVRRGIVFGKGAGKTGTLVVPRRSC